VKIALFGATGMIGTRILNEALSRGHELVAIVRNPASVPARPGVTAVAGDARESASVAATAAGCDIAISAYGPGSGSHDDLLKNAHALLEGLAEAGVPRVIVVGGAGSLEVAPGVALLDTPGFPEIYKPRATAQKAMGGIFKASAGTPVAWTFVSPALSIAPGERTGNFRVGTSALMTDAHGESKISAEDYAVALVDEAEQSKALNEHISVAY
jgi:putative NADH-flavin reductase